MLKKITLVVVTVLGFSGLFGLTLAPVSEAVNTKVQVQGGVDSSGGTGSSNSGDQVTKVIKNVIGIISFLVGLISVLMIVIAGFRFVTSNGDSNTITSAKNTIIYAIIGIVIAIMAYAIVNFVLDNLT